MILQASTQLPTTFGTFTVKVYKNKQHQEITTICSGDIQGRSDLPVRIHSACFTSEVLGSLKCDCKQQMDYALDYIAKHDGIILYLPQEGRGIGLGNKIRAYALQEQGYDTIEANQLLNLPIDCRTYEDAHDILKKLKINSVRLLTNNPLKLTGLSELGIHISGRIPVPSNANAHSVSYLDTKRELMGHMLKVRKPNPCDYQKTTQNIESIPRETSINNKEKRPFIHVNFALDSFARTTDKKGEAISLSCDKDWQRVHELREKYCAVAIGANTWLNDNPRLTVRFEMLGRKPTKQPDRVIFSGKQACQINQENDYRRTFIIGCAEKQWSAEHTVITSANHLLSKPLNDLFQYGVKSILVEGGLTLIKSFFAQKMVDIITIYVRTTSIPTAIQAAITALPNLAADEIEAKIFGEGILLSSTIYHTLSFNQQQYSEV